MHVQMKVYILKYMLGCCYLNFSWIVFTIEPKLVFSGTVWYKKKKKFLLSFDAKKLLDEF